MIKVFLKNLFFPVSATDIADATKLEIMQQALYRAAGNKKLAAELCGMARTTFLENLKVAEDKLCSQSLEISAYKDFNDAPQLKPETIPGSTIRNLCLEDALPNTMRIWDLKQLRKAILLLRQDLGFFETLERLAEQRGLDG